MNFGNAGSLPHRAVLQRHPPGRADPRPADLGGVDVVHLRRVGQLQRGPARLEDHDLAAVGRLVRAPLAQPENVADLVLNVRPFGVDASSGLEREVGRKDPDKVRRFIDRIRKTDFERPKLS